MIRRMHDITGTLHCVKCNNQILRFITSSELNKRIKRFNA